MYYEELERWTREELAGHLTALLAAEQSQHTDSLPLTFPAQIDTSSVVGGVIDATPNTLPQYAIDCESKELAAAGEDGWFYDYSGHITVMVWANRADRADALCKRHVKVIEQWINSHLNPSHSVAGKYYLHEMRYSSTIFAGAIPLEQSTKENTDSITDWISGAEINLVWRVAENGPYQSH